MSERETDQGFTLTETLIALLLISLSLAGVLQVARLVARGQDRVTVIRDLGREQRNAETDLRRQIAPLEPLRVAHLSGDGQGFSYDCQEEAPCRVVTPTGYRLAYVIAGQEYARWSYDSLTEEEASEVVNERLAGLILYDETGTVATTVELRIDHPADCQFDMITRQCRWPEP
ncbi:prepilin-type N-terminal cleavage/methylation domain-containing protein [Asticcacaulis tiandongensis]|uniref:prepilin-type N-terminal cleavage/methylation domain-containing protein n=1 Tax=Asticcacaulis tiandongensis TaxID=2565365 RepID=UPI00112D7782|nr:prepilin-type N-terminal cleavage/methylation domain-containing protein [Asticcacaulis tiandongensis]